MQAVLKDKAHVHLRSDGEEDEVFVKRAIQALDALNVVARALPNAEARKACIVAKQMRTANYDVDTSIAVVRALFGDQSEKDITKAFGLFDKSGDGSLQKQELFDALPLMGENVSKEKLEELHSLVDASGDGEVSLAEFAMLVKGINPKGGAENPFAAFQTGYMPDMPAMPTMPDMPGVPGGFAVPGSGAFGAMSAAWSANLEGLSPLEMRKAGVMLENMKTAGYSDEKAQAIVSAVLCDQSEANIEKAFKFFDKDGGGTLQESELKEALPLMGEDIPAKVIKDLFKKVDKDGSGKICLKEFVELVRGINPKNGEEGLADSLTGGVASFMGGWGGYGGEAPAS